jgi:hypothetical protein
VMKGKHLAGLERSVIVGERHVIAIGAGASSGGSLRKLCLLQRCSTVCQSGFAPNRSSENLDSFDASDSLPPFILPPTRADKVPLLVSPQRLPPPLARTRTSSHSLTCSNVLPHQRRRIGKGRGDADQGLHQQHSL